MDDSSPCIYEGYVTNIHTEETFVLLRDPDGSGRYPQPDTMWFVEPESFRVDWMLA